MIKRKGFTFIEIALFLAVTAALFIGIAVGMQNSITQQRYNESTQEFLEFMRSIYSKVSNPQSPGRGNSNRAIYGKLVVFGETYDITGNKITEGNPIFMYDVVGDIVTSQNIGTETLTQMLSKLNLDLSTPEKFEMPWQTSLQTTAGGKFVGSMLIVRHPRSGTINTLYWDGVINQNNPTVAATKPLAKNIKNFSSNNQIIFCISPYSVGKTGPIPKQPIRLLSNARNASDVELIDLDSNNIKCN
ncbi:hypothetical protein IJI18_02015 [Candidatus Saccharibacteria bacterium]|nr:hypothetical protein [Candidatus Saccharibacteria bacterium]